MAPFRVFDREEKTTWIVLNFQSNSSNGGQYLVAREDDSNNDGEIKLISPEDMIKMKLVDFFDDAN